MSALQVSEPKRPVTGKPAVGTRVALCSKDPARTWKATTKTGQQCSHQSSSSPQPRQIRTFSLHSRGWLRLSGLPSYASGGLGSQEHATILVLRRAVLKPTALYMLGKYSTNWAEPSVQKDSSERTRDLKESLQRSTRVLSYSKHRPESISEPEITHLGPDSEIKGKG